MELKLLGRSVRFSRTGFVGIVMVAVGVALLMLAYDSQIKIDQIGETNDPILQHRVSNFENLRDAFLATSIGSIFVGLFGVAIPVEPSLPAIISGQEMISFAQISGRILEGLSLTGNASYLPAKHGLSREKVFIATGRDLAAPPSALSDDLTVSPGADGSTPGIVLDPIGLSLLWNIEKELGSPVTGVGLEGVEGTLQMLKHGLGLMRDFHFKTSENGTKLRVEYSGLMNACRNVRKERPDTCRQLACIGCSCILTAAARATGKIVSVEKVDNTEDIVVFTVNMRDW